MDIELIKKSMTNHKPNQNQIEIIENIREEYKNLLDTLNDSQEYNKYKNISARRLEESLMWAVKGIILFEKK